MLKNNRSVILIGLVEMLAWQWLVIVIERYQEISLLKYAVVVMIMIIAVLRSHAVAGRKVLGAGVVVGVMGGCTVLTVILCRLSGLGPPLSLHPIIVWYAFLAFLVYAVMGMVIVMVLSFLQSLLPTHWR